MNEGTDNPNSNQKSATSPMLAKVFLWVLAVHVVVIVCFGAYHLLKGGGDHKLSTETATVDSSSDAKISDPTEQQATVQTEQGGTQTTVEPVHPESETAGMSMPSTNDPIWSSPAQAASSAVSKTGPGQSSTVHSGKSASPITDVKPAVAAGSYTVVKGDSLFKIAKKHSVTVAALKSANNLTTDNLKVGQSLSIPGQVQAAKTDVADSSTGTGPTEKMARAAVVNSKPGYKSYKVVQGDTLWKIAKNFKAKPAEIAKLNNISDPSKLKVGSTIKVPCGAARETASPVEQPAHTVLQNTDVAMVHSKKD